MLKRVAGASAAATYTWTAPYGGSWSDAQNWQVNGDAATGAPGAGVNVVIAGTSEDDITGTGNAANVTIGGDAVLFGTLAVSGTTTVGTTAGDYYFAQGRLDIDNGRLSTGTLAITTGVQVGTGSRLTAGALAMTGYSSLTVLDGGVVQAGTLQDSGLGATIFIDGASSLEIGTLGGAASGALTVDRSVTAVLDGDVQANVVDNGVIAITDGGFLSLPSIAEGGMASHVLSGTGAIDLGENSDLSVGGDIVSAAIDFLGPEAILAIETPATISAAINGFSAGDQIQFGNWVTGETWAQTSQSQGTLTLRDNGAVVGHLTLIGNYSGETFHLGPSSGGTASIGGAIGYGEVLTVRTIGSAPAIPTQIDGTSGHDTLSALSSGETLTGGPGNDLYDLNEFSNLTVKDSASDLNGATLSELGGYATMKLDVTDLAAGTAHAMFTAGGGSYGTGTLTLSDGTHMAVIDLSLLTATGGMMPLSSSSFSFVSDGHGGTKVTIHG